MKKQQYTVLLVEDEKPTSRVLQKVFEQEGYNVIVVGDGEKGLQTALSRHPDVILADLLLPRMSGMDMIREIRKDAWGKNAEIIILTNVLDVKMLEEAMSQGTYFYVVKGDSSMADVIAKVNSRLEARSAKDRASA